MRSRTLGYGDAVKLLGGGESRVLTALSNLAGAALTAFSAGGSATALGLFDLKGEVDRMGRDAVGALRDRVRGLDRFSRTELLEAAHTVIVITSFFEALDDLDESLNTALNTASLELTGQEQATLAAGGGYGARPGRMGLADLADFLTRPQTGATIGRPALLGIELLPYYGELGRRMLLFAHGTAVWDRTNETRRSAWAHALMHELSDTAVVRYEENLRRLAVDFPEVAFWAYRLGIGAVLDELYAARRAGAEAALTLADLGELMRRMSRMGGPGQDPGRVRSELVKGYRAELDRRIGGVDPWDGVTLPTLRQVYVNPSYREMPSPALPVRAEQLGEEAWRTAEVRPDLWAFVVSQLVRTDASRAPLVLLGQPGAGKSVFTQVLAAQLDPADFLVVRVELRSVPSDAEVHDQIETAVKKLTRRNMSWPDLIDGAGNAQPVVILDGLDELLHASGVSHFDYLEKVQRFQLAEADLGRPVAVLVTSRTAVADQVRYPEGSALVRLEQFDDTQVARWLEAWNAANPARPLTPDSVRSLGDLARQPLLLFLLALFRSGGGELTADLSPAELYGRLFTRFIERDVDKFHADLSGQARRREIDRELDRLSIVAFAMFNRGRQMVRDTELIDDFGALPITGPPADRPADADARREARDAAQRMAGRFFFKLFVQGAGAIYGQSELHRSYEFLHASFQEYLVARWVVEQLSRLVQRETPTETETEPYPTAPDDGLLRTLLSVAVLSAREQRILDFIAQLLAALPGADALAGFRGLLLDLFRGCLRPRGADPYPRYRPAPRTAPAMYAAYSANLCLLLLLVAEVEAGRTGSPETGGLPITELLDPGTAPDDVRREWHSVTRLWHAQLTAPEWDSLLRVVRLEATGVGEAAETWIARWSPQDYDRDLLYEARGLLPYLGDEFFPVPDGAFGLDDPAGVASREATLLGLTGYQHACATLLPYQAGVGTAAAATLHSGAEAAEMVALLVPRPGVGVTSADDRFELCGGFLRSLRSLRHARLVLEWLKAEAPSLPGGELARLASMARPAAWTNILAYLDILACLHDDRPSDLPGARELADTPILIAPLDPHNLVDLVGLHDLAGMTALRDLNDARDPFDLIGPLGLVGLRDLLGLRDLQGLLGLYGSHDAVSRYDPPSFFDLLILALWAAMVDRGLPADERPYLTPDDRPYLVIDGRTLAHLEEMTGGFVTRVRRLAADEGYADPFRGSSAI